MTTIAGFWRARDERAWRDEPFDGRPTNDPRSIFCLRPEGSAEPFWAATAARRARFQALLDEVTREARSMPRVLN
jgi:hypothetical protein